MGQIAPVSGALVALSSSSVFPERMPDAFETAARLGYDGVEVMVTTDLISQNVDVLRRLVDYHGVPVLAVHAPCLLITQRVWGREPWGKLNRARQAAEQLGARVVVLHPPFRWQREYAREFEAGLARMGAETDVMFAVENLYPLRARGAEVAAYAPSWNPVELDCRHVTLDLSHTAVSGSDALAMAAELEPPGWRTCTWPMAPSRACLMSTSSRAGASSHARNCCSAWRLRATAGWWCWRSVPSGRRAARIVRLTWPNRWPLPAIISARTAACCGLRLQDQGHRTVVD